MPKYNYAVALSGDGAPSTTPDEIRREFARRVTAARMDKGFNQAELARAAAKYMADGKFGRDLIGLYERALRLPSPMHLSAMARALGKDTQELMPYQGVPGGQDNRFVPVDVKDMGDGQAWVRINEQVPWDVALKVMELVRGAKPKT